MAKNHKHDTSDSRIASLKAQDKEYNEMYRKWRIEHKQDYGFYFFDNSDELTYRDGEGFITEYPEAVERSAVTGIHSLVANALIIYIVINILVIAVDYFTPFKTVHDLSYNSLGFFTGDEGPAIVMTYVVNILRRLIPIFYIVSKTGIPMRVLVPVKISNKPLFLMAVPMAMCIMGINILLSKFEFLFVGIIGIDGMNRIWLPDEPVPSVMYCILSVLIVPILSEFMHRGLIMQVLRQFGDGYALVATSIFAAITIGNPGTYLFHFVSSLMIGYFSIRTGSFITAVLMRVTISASSYFMTVVRDSGRFEANFDTKEERYVILADEFREYFRKKGFVPQSTEDAKASIQYMDEVMKKIREINRRNNILKRKYKGDERFVRIHKRIEEQNQKRERPIISAHEYEIAENLAKMKDEIDRQLFLDINILDNEPAFGQDVLSIIGKELIAMKIRADIKDRKYLSSLITTEYLQQRNYAY